MAAIRQRLQQLMQQRDAIEQEISERTSRLNAPGGAGQQGSLLDAEGFPRSDIDVTAVRTDRNRVICLTNDHKAITKQIEEALQELHASTRTSNGVNSQLQDQHAAPANSINAMGLHPQVPRPSGEVRAEGLVATPFAVIDDVTTGSPAAIAGLQLGDRLCKFGDIGASLDRNEIHVIAQLVQASEGSSIPVIILREGSLVTLTITPQRWDGRGLLGCHLQPTP